MSHFASPPAPLVRSQGFRRLLRWSAGGHLLLVGAFVSQAPLYQPALMEPVFVEIVAALPAEPAAIKPPRQVIDEAIVIPKRPRRKPRRRQPPEPIEEKVPDKPQPTPEELLDKLRAKHASPADVKPKTATQAGPGLADPLIARYRRQIKDQIYRNWAGAQAFSMRLGLQVSYRLVLDSSGGLRQLQLLGSSGEPALDESAERAVYKAAPFPPPPGQLRALTLIFDPREVR